MSRCACRCECTHPAVIKVRYNRRWWQRLLNVGWANVCWDCHVHVLDQIEETGRIWKP